MESKIQNQNLNLAATNLTEFFLEKANDALREYERTAREKNRPTLNRLAKQQVFTTLQLRLVALEAADEAQVPRDRRRPGASRRPSRRAKRATRLTGR